MGIIFDLDQTLIDSFVLESLRKSRNWSEVYKQIPTISVYEGIKDLFEWLYDKQIPIAIVTNSPESYCKRIIQANEWSINATVCYHDVRRRKPSAEPMELALQKLGINNENALSVGDRYSDILASKNANISCVAALWGTNERDLLLTSNANFKAETVEELTGIVVSFFTE